VPDGRNYCEIATRYAEQVVSGHIPACEWVRMACQDDLARKDFAWKFDEDRGNDICWFIEKLPHVKGRWKSKTIDLEPWQCFCLTTIFGWIDEEGFRRFRKALIVIPRKNTKSTTGAGVGLYLFGRPVRGATFKGGDGRSQEIALLRTFSRRVTTKLMKYQSCRPAVRAGFKRNLGVDHLKEILLPRLGKQFHFRLSGGLRVKMVALAGDNNAEGWRELIRHR
jgi:hypothetical protein